MKHLMLWTVALAMLSGSALFAQDITGTWQGTLHAGRDLRTVIKISKTESGGLKAVLYSIDQGGQGIFASAVTLKGSAVTISIPAIDGTYQGKLNGDATAIAGTWTQGSQALTTLTWTPDQFQFAGTGIPVPPPADSADAPPGLFTAIQKQLGLKLKSTKAPAEVLVIDHVERPSPN
jgi:uncharacterized protein (TIGR03435 family)